MAFKKELPRWLRPPQTLLRANAALLRCTAFRFFVFLTVMMFVLVNIFANSRGYSTVIEYYRDVPLDVTLQMDIICPLYQRDDAMRVFGEELGKAIRDYLDEGHAPSSSSGSTDHKNPRITRFRLLLTRYPTEGQDEESIDKLRNELSILTWIVPQDIVIVKPPSDAVFERASAVNLLQKNACSRDTCLVARMDADMTILPVFFDNAVSAVYLNRTAYFPIVWSEYYPLAVELAEKQIQMEDHKALEEYSEHRGYWREHGTGMYCLSGPHAHKYQLKESFKGWGGEDGNYYKKLTRSVTKYRITRLEEPGLIHRWHPKYCILGVDVHNDKQWKDCNGARIGQMGSELGLKLLREHWEQNMPDEYRHHSIVF